MVPLGCHEIVRLRILTVRKMYEHFRHGGLDFSDQLTDETAGNGARRQGTGAGW
jgi:hypothetical protein